MKRGEGTHKRGKSMKKSELKAYEKWVYEKSWMKAFDNYHNACLNLFNEIMKPLRPIVIPILDWLEKILEKLWRKRETR